MNNRELYGVILAIGIVALLAGGVGILWAADAPSPNNDTASPASERALTPPEQVNRTKALGAEFNRRVKAAYPDSSVYIMGDGSLAIDYNSSAESASEVRTEINNIANEYGRILKENSSYNATTLTIITGEIQAIVPSTTATAYANGEIERQGFLETIEVMGIERRTPN